MNKTLLISTLISVFTLPACTEEEITNFFGGDIIKVTVSGKTNNISDSAEPAVLVKGIYISSDDASNSETTSDDNGDFTLQVNENDSFYLRASKSGFVSKSTEQMSLSSDVTDIVINIPTETEAQDIIDTAFSLSPQLFNHAWLTVDVVTATGDEVNGESIALPATPAWAVYTACDGTDSDETETTGAPCATDRYGTMYIAYYDTAGDVVVSVGEQSQTATVSIGEITSLKFVLP